MVNSFWWRNIKYFAQTSTPATVTYTPANDYAGIKTLTYFKLWDRLYYSYFNKNNQCNRGSHATAGGPDYVCQSATPSAITLSGASIGGSATTGTWSITSGGGTLSNTAQTSNPESVIYTPADGFAGIVTLTLTSNFYRLYSSYGNQDDKCKCNYYLATAGGPDYVCQSSTPHAITLLEQVSAEAPQQEHGRSLLVVEY